MSTPEVALDIRGKSPPYEKLASVVHPDIFKEVRLNSDTIRLAEDICSNHYSTPEMTHSVANALTLIETAFSSNTVPLLPSTGETDIYNPVTFIKKEGVRYGFPARIDFFIPGDIRMENIRKKIIETQKAYFRGSGTHLYDLPAEKNIRASLEGEDAILTAGMEVIFRRFRGSLSNSHDLHDFFIYPQKPLEGELILQWNDGPDMDTMSIDISVPDVKPVFLKNGLQENKPLLRLVFHGSKSVPSLDENPGLSNAFIAARDDVPFYDLSILLAKIALEKNNYPFSFVINTDLVNDVFAPAVCMAPDGNDKMEMTTRHAEMIALAKATKALTYDGSGYGIAAPCMACALNIKQMDLQDSQYLLAQTGSWNGLQILQAPDLMRECGHSWGFVTNQFIDLKIRALDIFRQANQTEKFKGMFNDMIRENEKQIRSLEKILRGRERIHRRETYSEKTIHKHSRKKGCLTK